MKKVLVVISIAASASALLMAFGASAQDASRDLRGPQFYDPLADPDQSEDSASKTLRRREHDLGMEAHRLVREYSRTEDPSSRRRLEEELHKKVDDHFSVKQQLREQELADLEAQLRRLRSRHERRDGARDRIVRDRVEQLLREADGLGWGSGNSHQTDWFRFELDAPAPPPAAMPQPRPVIVIEERSAREAEEAREAAPVRDGADR